MRLVFAIAEGRKGRMLLIRQGDSWWILSGTPFKRKEPSIEETFEVDASQLLTRIADRVRRVSDAE